MLDRSTIASVCPYCGVGCGLFINTSDGKITGIEYMKSHPTNEGALCPKDNACLEIVYHNERLRYPPKRWGTVLCTFHGTRRLTLSLKILGESNQCTDPTRWITAILEEVTVMVPVVLYHIHECGCHFPDYFVTEPIFYYKIMIFVI